MSNIIDPPSSIPHPSFLLCPGQGAQAVGMGRSWFEKHDVAKQTFAAADEALGFKLSTLCFEGPADVLNRTDTAQVAIYVASVACYQALLETDRLGKVAATAGLSLGEFTALHLAGAFSFADGLRLVKLRGEAMQQAAEAGKGTMVALTGEVSEEKVLELCAAALQRAGAGEVLVPANFNSPMQVVVSGSQGACEQAAAVASEMGLKPTMLVVAGAFHSPLMAPAAERLAAALEQVSWSAPRVPVYSNVTGEPHDPDPASIRQRLVQQLTQPVRWSQSMQHAVANPPGGDAANSGGPPSFVELAPGKVLAGLMRRIDRSANVTNFAEAES